MGFIGKGPKEGSVLNWKKDENREAEDTARVRRVIGNTRVEI